MFTCNYIFSHYNFSTINLFSLGELGLGRAAAWYGGGGDPPVAVIGSRYVTQDGEGAIWKNKQDMLN